MAEKQKVELTAKEKAIKVAHRFTEKLGIVHRSPQLVAMALKFRGRNMPKDRKDKIDKLVKLLEDHPEWCWEEFSDETKKMQKGRDPELMEAWLDAIKGNKILLNYTKQFRKPEDYPEITKEKWEV